MKTMSGSIAHTSSASRHEPNRLAIGYVTSAATAADKEIAPAIIPITPPIRVGKSLRVIKDGTTLPTATPSPIIMVPK